MIETPCLHSCYNNHNHNYAPHFCRLSEQTEIFFHHQNKINIRRLTKTILRLADNTPPHLLSSLRRRATVGITTNQGEEDAKEEEEGGNRSSSEWPLPLGQYPVFDGYPKYVVDYQMRERAKIAMEQEEIRKKAIFLDELTKKSEELHLAEMVGPIMMEDSCALSLSLSSLA